MPSGYSSTQADWTCSYYRRYRRDSLGNGGKTCGSCAPGVTGEGGEAGNGATVFMSVPGLLRVMGVIEANLFDGVEHGPQDVELELQNVQRPMLRGAGGEALQRDLQPVRHVPARQRNEAPEVSQSLCIDPRMVRWPACQAVLVICGANISVRDEHTASCQGALAAKLT